MKHSIRFSAILQRGSVPLFLLAFALRSGPSEAAEASSRCAALDVAVEPSESGPQRPHTTASYRVNVTQTAPADCGTQLYVVVREPDEAFSSTVSPGLFSLGPGASTSILASVTATSAALPGEQAVPLTLRVVTAGNAEHSVLLPYDVAPEPACHVLPDRELFIRELSVVDDPVRTRFDPAAKDGASGAWSFGELMRRASPDPENTALWVEALFASWLSEQSRNGFVVPARPAMARDVLGPWPRTPDGRLDLERAPLRLLAIASRIDLRRPQRGSAGEGRFVFGVLAPGGFDSSFTLILEYRLPARSRARVLGWARAWHALGALEFPSEAYNEALQTLTDRFTRRGALEDGVNGSALSSLRTNELALGPAWEFRQFRLARTTGLLRPTPLEGTPDLSWLGSIGLGQFLDENEVALESGEFRVPRRYRGQPLLAAAAINSFPVWDGPGTHSSLARQNFALGTCNGCHGAPETATAFLHVRPRAAGEVAGLSGFLTGTATLDPLTGETRIFNDMGRRKLDLEALVCDCTNAGCGALDPPRAYRDHTEPADD